MFYGHHAKIVCLAWSPDNEHFASGGMDMMVYVWTLSDPETRVKIQGDSHTHRLPGAGPRAPVSPLSFWGGHPVKACLLPPHQAGHSGTDSRCGSKWSPITGQVLSQASDSSV